MNRWLKILTVPVGLMVVCSFVLADRAWAEPLKEDEVKQIADAMQVQARSKPVQPRRLLVFTNCGGGWRHSSIPWAAKALEMMGQKTGAFEAVVSDDVSMFEPDKISQFDAIVFDNNTGTPLRPVVGGDFEKLSAEEKKAVIAREDQLKAGLLNFVTSGKGIVGIHAATDCYYEWLEYGRMMGAYFINHPWSYGVHGKTKVKSPAVGIKLDDPEHPLVAVFGGQGFKIRDEIYQFRAPYSRNQLRVLLSIDVANTEMNLDYIKQNVRRRDADFAVSWIRSYGKGRVFYCSLGHANEIFTNKTILQYYLDGIQFALGDLPADTTPSALLAGGRGRPVDLKEAMRQLPDYSYDMYDDRVALNVVAEHVRAWHDNPQERANLAARLTAILDSDATPDAKDFICRQLNVIGGAQAVPVLAKMLYDEKIEKIDKIKDKTIYEAAVRTSNMARYALEGIPDPAAAAALREALGSVKDNTLLVGVINSVARRGDVEAVGRLVELAKSGEPMVVSAAATALANIGGPKAVAAVADAHKKAPAVLAEARAKAAAATEAESKAKEIAAAAEANAKAADASTAAKAKETAESAQTDANAAAAATAQADKKALDADRMIRIVGDSYLKCADRLLRLGERGKAAEIYEEMYGPRELQSVRVAALRGVVAVRQGKALPMVLEALGSEDALMQGGAASLVLMLPGDRAVTDAFAKRLSSIPSSARVKLLGALAARGDAAARPAVIAMADDEDAPVRVAAIKALTRLGDGSTVKLLAGRAANIQKELDHDAAGPAVQPQKGLDPATRNRMKAELDAARESLNRVMGPGVEEAMLVAMKDGETAVRAEVIRSAGARRMAAAIPGLLEYARDADGSVRIASLRALGELAGEGELDALVGLLVAEKPEKEREEVEKAVGNCCSRLTDPEGRSRPVVAAYPGADPAARISIVKVLGRIGGAAALDVVRSALKDENAGIKSASVGALANWPDQASIADLREIVKNSPDMELRVIAFRGFVRLAGLPGVRPEEQTLELYAEAIRIVPRAEEKKLILAGLGGQTSLEALRMAAAYLDDPALKGEAVAAVMKISNEIRGIYGEGVIPFVEKVQKVATDEQVRKDAAEAIDRFTKSYGYITGTWEVCDPYTQESVEAGAMVGDGSLLNRPFPPEVAGSRSPVTWRNVPAHSGSNPWSVDLNVIFKGRREIYRPCVVYLRTNVWSAVRQNVVLALGHDQGIKAWLNGRLLYACELSNRPAILGQDAVAMTSLPLQEGWNTILLKLHKDGGPWTTSARLCTTSGSKLQGINVRTEAAK